MPDDRRRPRFTCDEHRWEKLGGIPLRLRRQRQRQRQRRWAGRDSRWLGLGSDPHGRGRSRALGRRSRLPFIPSAAPKPVYTAHVCARIVEGVWLWCCPVRRLAGEPAAPRTCAVRQTVGRRGRTSVSCWLMTRRPGGNLLTTTRGTSSRRSRRGRAGPMPRGHDTRSREVSSCPHLAADLHTRHRPSAGTLPLASRARIRPDGVGPCTTSPMRRFPPTRALPCGRHGCASQRRAGRRESLALAVSASGASASG